MIPLPIHTTGEWRFLEGAPIDLFTDVPRFAVPGPFWEDAAPATGIYVKHADGDPHVPGRYGAAFDGMAVVHGWPVTWSRKGRSVWRFPHDPRGLHGWAFQSPLVSAWNPLLGGAWIRQSWRRWFDCDVLIVKAVALGHKPAGYAYLEADQLDEVDEYLTRSTFDLHVSYDAEHGTLYVCRKEKYGELFNLGALANDYLRHLPPTQADEQVEGLHRAYNLSPADFMSYDGETELDVGYPLSVVGLTWGYPHQITIGHLLRPNGPVEHGGMPRAADLAAARA